MFEKRIITKKAFLITSGMLFMILYVTAQLPNYTVDEDFNTENLFRGRGSVSDIYIQTDDRILVVGGFDNDWNDSPFRGYGLLTGNGVADMSWAGTDAPYIVRIVKQDDGYVFPTIQSIAKISLEGNSWFQEYGHYWCEYIEGGIFNPYTVESVWTLHQQEDGKIILGGAIATDTLQPGLFRCLSRVYADGTHDSTFPILEAGPNSPNTSVRKIYRASNGYWYVSGAFESINGHETHHIARLTPEFEVDTDFVSPFMFEGLYAFQPQIAYVDSQDRLWVSGGNVRLTDNPNDTLQVVRLLPNGEVDMSFGPRYLKADYPDEWNGGGWRVRFEGVIELQSNPGNYLVFGHLNSMDDEPLSSLTVVNDSGIIQNHYFQGQGATENDWGYVLLNIPTNPRVDKVLELENGDLLVGGVFSNFMGSTHYNMVKLNLGVLSSVEKSELDRKFKVYPNPNSEYVNLSFEGLDAGMVRILNSQGQEIVTHQMNGEALRVDTSELAKGIYFVTLEVDDNIAVKKMVIN